MPPLQRLEQPSKYWATEHKQTNWSFEKVDVRLSSATKAGKRTEPLECLKYFLLNLYQFCTT